MYRASSWSVLLILVAAIVGCANPATGKPEAVVEEAAPAPATAVGARYTIAPESTIEFIGSKVTGSHTGGFHKFTGEIVRAASVEASSVRVVIEATSLWASTAIVATTEGYSITANLELHGVARSITFPATIEMTEDSITADAEFTLMRFDFGLIYPGRADDLIRDEVVVKFHLVAVPASGAVAGVDDRARKAPAQG